MIELFILVGIIALVYVLQNHHRKKAYRNFYKNKYPFWFPIVGNAYIFAKTNILKVILATNKLYGDTYLLYIPHRSYVTSRPEELKIILNHPNCLDKSKEYNHLQMILKNTLLLIPARQWKRNRKILSKSFKTTILESFTYTFYQKSAIIVDILKKEHGINQDICYLFQKFTLDTFSEATLGVKSTIMEDKKEHVFVTGVKEVQQLAYSRIAHIIKMNDFLFSFTDDYRKIKNHVKACNNYISEIMQEKKKNWSKDNVLNLLNLPVLDYLMTVSEKEELTNKYIEEEMFLFAAAATDTTAYSMAYTCFLLALHPEIQEKVYKEVMTICNYHEIDNSHLVNLKYTEMMIMESQRLIPVIPIVGRVAHADIDLGETIIPANTNIIINFMSMHRNPEFYPNPLVFDPDRFLPEEIAKRPQYSFLPFSGGPRNCIGFKYAMMVMKTTIANIVRHFHLTTTHRSIQDVDFESSVVMIPTVPLNIKFTERKNEC